MKSFEEIEEEKRRLSPSKLKSPRPKIKDLTENFDDSLNLVDFPEDKIDRMYNEKDKDQQNQKIELINIEKINHKDNVLQKPLIKPEKIEYVFKDSQISKISIVEEKEDMTLLGD
jgi:hypothetical protein